MKILVDQMPENPQECLFSYPRMVGDRLIFTCSLRPYIPDEQTARSHHKPNCLCKCRGKCDLLKEVAD
jgi:hypothetical protein